MLRRPSVRLDVVTVLLAAVAVASCAAASAFFDLPEKPKTDGGTTANPASVAAGAAESDTLRPAIESIANPDSVLALLPRDQLGNVDWVKALDERIIRPRRMLPGGEAPPDMSGFAYDFLLPGPNQMFDATVPHSAHVAWLACGSCHPEVFPYPNTPITMDAVNKGEACGRCHSKVSFPLSSCSRCHTGMPGSGQQAATLGSDVTLARGGSERADAAGTESYPPARFPHWVHRIRYRCMACHPALFEMQAGADTISMADLNAGRACGACHNGNTAFDALQCNRCHVPPEVR